MRGRACHREGRVEQVPTENGEVVSACVRADREYSVRLSTEEPGAEASCTCPEYSDDGHYCEHIWAVLMEVDEKGVISRGEEEARGLSRPGWPKAGKAKKRDRSAEAANKAEAEWQDRLTLLRQPMVREDESQGGLPIQASVCYVVQTRLSERYGGVVVELMHRQPTRSGWSRLKAFKLNPLSVRELSDPEDRELCALVMGGTTVQEEGMDFRFARDRSASAFRLPGGASYSLLRRMVETGRCYLGGDGLEDDEQIIESGVEPLRWDGGEPWRVWVSGLEGVEGLEVTVELRRGEGAEEEVLNVADPDLVLGGDGGVVVHEGVIGRLEEEDAFDWVNHFRDDMPERGRSSPIKVPEGDIEVFLERLYLLPHLPDLDLPDGVGWPERETELRGHLDMYSPGKEPDGIGNRTAVTARVWFEYDGHRVEPGAPGRYVPRGARREEAEDEAHDGVTGEALEGVGVRELVRRDREGEARMLGQLLRAGFKSVSGASAGTLQLPVKLMPLVANELIGSRWSVKADQKLIRGAGTPSLSITSGVDWFELRGGVRYETGDGEQVVPLPEILAAAREGRRLVTLGDGTQGMLPEEWLRRHNLLTAIGEASEDGLRFKLSQAALLDALLDARELEDVDAKFDGIRKRLREFEGVKPSDATDSFGGELRPYQREGLGWVEFLNWFGMGGILADDMGLGKTIQVLALLEKRIRLRDGGGDEALGTCEARPTLVVAPKSVVFNWVDEAKRFTPHLRVLNYAGAERASLREQFDQTDLVVTSYGLLRRDIATLKDFAFDYAVLDEAQVIKNPSSQSAKAARLLNTQHRLALTGTPVENHMGDLW
ncbi:MAG: SNF2-related protein, partial [Planctomycetota bacterium]